MTFLFYRFFVSPLARLALNLIALFSRGKLHQLVQEKNSRSFHLNGSWDETSLREARPIWIHAASGEIEYARPLLREIHRRHPHVPLLVTYSSPSAIRLIEGLQEIAAWGASPWENPAEIRRFFARFQPRALLVARTDLWPEMIEQVSRQKIPALLFAATFANNSSRLKGWTKKLTERSMNQLQGVHLVSADDAEVLSALKIATDLKVCGDTRFDQVLYRLQNPKPVQENLRPAKAPVFIAGSTWPEDEAVLVPALAQAPTHWSFLLAPHEISETHLGSLEGKLASVGLKSQRYSRGGAWNERVLILDQVGILAELYTWADLAFVGGSFKKQVHSVMEPLAAGLRVLIGPHHRNNREALRFQEEWAGSEPTVMTFNEPQELSRLLSDSELLGDRDEIRELVASQRGATEHVIEWLEERQLLQDPRGGNGRS